MSKDREYVEFLQWLLPRAGLRWEGFRRVRGQVVKRLARRTRELGLADLPSYRRLVETDAEERSRAIALCRVTISRFARDRAVFERLRVHLLEMATDAKARGASVRALSAGCASGEEPYSLAILWNLEVAPAVPGVALEVVAFDATDAVIARARAATYEEGSLGELPARWRVALEEEGALRRVRDEHRRLVAIEKRDLRDPLPGGPFDLVLCRNLAFTYFDEAGQRDACARFARVMRPGALLVVGAHEELPAGVPGFALEDRAGRAWRRVPD